MTKMATDCGRNGSDCLGTSNRHGATSVHRFELLPASPESRKEAGPAPGLVPWPNWPMILRTSSSHEEGVERDYSLNTKKVTGDENGNVQKLHGVRLEWQKADDGRMQMVEVPGGGGVGCSLAAREIVAYGRIAWPIAGRPSTTRPGNQR